MGQWAARAAGRALPPSSVRLALPSLAHGLPLDPWVVNIDGSGLHRVAALGEDDPIAAWSPDGSMLAVLGGGGLWLVAVDDSAEPRSLGRGGTDCSTGDSRVRFPYFGLVRIRGMFQVGRLVRCSCGQISPRTPQTWGAYCTGRARWTRAGLGRVRPWRLPRLVDVRLGQCGVGW